MFRLLGRIFLAIAAGLLLYAGISGIIKSLNVINGLGGWGAVTGEGYWQAILDFGIAIAHIIIAIPALLGFIRGKCGFWMFIFALVLGGLAGYEIYRQVTAGTLADGRAVWNMILSLAMPIAYALGTIFILLRRRGGGSKE